MAKTLISENRKVNLLKSKMIEDNSIKIATFASIVSNPPYQIDVAIKEREHGTRNSVDIFPDLQKLSSIVSQKTTLLYPATWYGNITNKNSLGYFLMHNGLKSIQTFEGKEVFGNFIKEGYLLSVVHCVVGSKEKPVIDGVQQKYSNIIIQNKKQEILLNRVENYKTFANPLFDITTLDNLTKSGLKYSKKPDKHYNVKIYIKLSPGKQADANYYYVNKNDLSSFMVKKEYLNKYVVSIQQAPLGRQSIFNASISNARTWNAKIFKKNEVFSKTYVGIGLFNTLSEAENFQAYLNTEFFVVLSSLHYKRKDFAKFVPDFGDYSNNNPIFTPDTKMPIGHEYKGLNLEQRLYKFFGLTDEEIQVFSKP